jgi:hypothetical protein
MTEQATPQDPDQPPVFRKWRGWYLLVICVLLIQIILYTLITNSFR